METAGDWAPSTPPGLSIARPRDQSHLRPRPQGPPQPDLRRRLPRLLRPPPHPDRLLRRPQPHLERQVPLPRHPRISFLRDLCRLHRDLRPRLLMRFSRRYRSIPRRKRHRPQRMYRTPAFTAVQVRRPSGRFQGVLNIGVMVNESNSDFASLSGVSAIGYRDLMGKSFRRRHREKSKADDYSHEAEFRESPDLSEVSESSPSNSPLHQNVLKDLNGRGNLGAAKTLRRASSGSGFLCCLAMQKKAVVEAATPTADLRSSEKSF